MTINFCMVHLNKKIFRDANDVYSRDMVMLDTTYIYFFLIFFLLKMYLFVKSKTTLTLTNFAADVAFV